MKPLKVSLFLLCGLSTTGIAQTLTPYSVTARNFAYIGKPGFNAAPTAISLFSSSNPTASDGGFGAGTPITFTNGAAQNLNAAGINQTDGFLYAMEYLYAGPFSSNAKLFRVGENAVAAMVGVIPGPTGADAGRSVQYSFVNTASATMDVVGDYWFTAYTFTDINPPFNTSKLDVFVGKISGTSLLAPGTTVLTPQYYKLDVSDPILQAGYNNFMTSILLAMTGGIPVSNVNGGWQDMDIHPTSGKLFSYISFPSSVPTSTNNEPPLNSHLVRIDPVNSGGYWGKVNVINTTPNSNPDFEQDGSYFDALGNYYVVFTNGQYGTVNTTTGAISALTTSSLPLQSGQMRGDLATNTSTNVPLPVVLVAFNGTAAKDGNSISWQTGAEKNMSHYILERSANSRDFTALTTLGAKGSDSKYAYTDRDATASQYYRLKMVELSGEFSYSKVVTISSASSSSVSIYPNVISDNKLFVHGTARNTTLRITDLYGRIVLATSAKGEATDYAVDLNCVPGTYIASVISEQGKVLGTATIVKY